MVLRSLSRVLFSLAVTSLLFLFFTSYAFAQNEAGVGIKPAVIENNALPGSEQTHKIEVTNLGSSPQTYYLYTRDIVSMDESGRPIFADEDAEKTGYELSQWVEISTKELTIEGQGTQSFDMTLTIPENATPGSHFGAVSISVVPPKMRENGASVGYEVSNLISIFIEGDVVENANIRQFSTGNFIYGEPLIDFHARIENKGSTLVRPIGPLEVYNMFGKRVAMLTFNESKAAVFPGLHRDYEITWEDEGPGFGRYEAILSLVYGAQGRQSTISSTVSFWILPMNIFLPAMGVLAVLLLITFISVKLYIRNKVHGATGGSRRVVRQQRRPGGMSALLLVIIVMLSVTALFLLILLALFA